MKAKKTREKILDTSIKLFNEKKSSNVSTVQISNDMKISPGNLYYYYANKEEIIKCIWSERMLEEINTLASAYEDAENMQAFIECMKRSIEHCRKYIFFYTEMPTLFINDMSLKELCDQAFRQLREKLMKLYGVWISDGSARITEEGDPEMIVENAILLFAALIQSDDMYDREYTENTVLLRISQYIMTCLTEPLQKEMSAILKKSGIKKL